MNPSVSKFKRLLSRIDSELRADNIKSLKFLCESNLGAKKSAANFSTGFEIFDALEKHGKLSEDKQFYLCELMITIGRVDLATIIDPRCDSADHQCRHIDQFRLMLYKLSEELTSDEVLILRFLYKNMPKRVNIADGRDLFLLMLQHKTVSPTNLDYLKQLLEEIHRHDLCEILSSFNPGCTEQTQDCCASIIEVVAVPESTFSECSDTPDVVQFSKLNIAEDEPKDQSQTVDDKLLNNSFSAYNVSSTMDHTYWVKGNQLSNMSIYNQHSSSLNIPVSTEPAQAFTSAEHFGETTAASSGEPVEGSIDKSYTPLAYYKMDATPRGICVVIDNQVFNPDKMDREAVQNLSNRPGSDKDSVALRATFEKLHFIVEENRNLTDTQIIDVLKEISARNHKKYDCFVCCILTHGGDNCIFGVNGRKVLIGDITSLFRAQSCQTLAQKPKLFFLASCRGKSQQPGVQLPLFEMDKPEVETGDWIPNESDFLFGYATVINHVSYRSKTQGTFYINALTEVLDKYAYREDLQTLLVRVNDAVSDKIYSQERETGTVVYKQTPAPQHTLRKHLKFL